MRRAKQAGKRWPWGTPQRGGSWSVPRAGSPTPVGRSRHLPEWGRPPPQQATAEQPGIQRIGARPKQQQRQRQADGQGQRQRTEQHQQGIKGGLADIGPLARIQVAEEAAGSGDDHRRSSSTCTPAATNAACAADWSPPTRATTSWPYGVSLIRSMRPDRML
ncbi:hypothetical protein G6F68_012869 [Rhizopus microsporus]|nr:hypothetical protein G6F68_012869 [Rhizopus microsporus]